MKRNFKNTNNTIGVFAILAILAFAIIPQASAMTAENTPITAVEPSIAIINGEVDLVWKGNPDSNKDPHDLLLTRIHEPTTSSLPVGDSDASGSYFDCADNIRIDKVDGSLNDPVQWELRVANTDPGTNDGEPFQFFDLEGNEQVKVRFGTSGTVSPVVTLNGGDGVTLSGTVLEWVNILPANSDLDTLSKLGQYGWESCGTELAGQADWSVEESILVQLPVGGEILPISTTALLLAGMSTSAMWIVPTIGTIAGAGIALYKIQRKQ